MPDRATKWWYTFPKRCVIDYKLEEPTDLDLDLSLEGEGRIYLLRQRLRSISWLLGSLKENLAKRAHAQDKCTGKFWEGR